MGVDEKEIEAEVMGMNLFHVTLLLQAYLHEQWGRPTAIITSHGKELAAWIVNQEIYRETVNNIVAQLKESDKIQ